MIFHKSTYNDIVKYYSNNIVKLKETEDRLWQIVSITPHEVSLRDCDGFYVYLDLNEEYEVDYPLPGRVVYQNGEYASFLYRKPAKQYNRGIHNQNTGLLILSNGKWQTFDISIERLQQFVDKPCYQDVNNLTEGYASWAISPQFALCSGKIFCLNKEVGAYSTADKRVVLKSKLLLPEVKALFKDWSVS